MTLLDVVRRSLTRHGLPTGREEVPARALLAVVVIVAAQLSEPGSLLDLALLVAGGLALVAAGVVRRVPIEVFVAAVVVPVTVAVGREGNVEVAYFLVVMMTLYSAWSLASTIRSLIIAAASCLSIVVVTVINPESFGTMPWIAAMVFTLVLGRTLHRHNSLIVELEAARRALADAAVAEERRRIARELHDLGGHTLAAVLLHVTGARHVLRRNIDEADRALADAESVGRAGMDQIRATVWALRTTERGVDPPPPGAYELDALVAEYRRVGLTIEASIDDDVAALGGPVGVALHRIGREALTNVTRHAPTNQVVVTAELDAAEQRVRLEITDHGCRPVPRAGSVGRYGLVGMRERARSLGGSLVAEPSDDGWRVEALLPLGGEVVAEATRP